MRTSVQEGFDQQLWMTRLNEGLALLDTIMGTQCDCDPEWEEGTSCIQCYAHKVQRLIQDGGIIADATLQDTVEDVLCRLDDTSKVVFSSEHELECIRYWSQAN